MKAEAAATSFSTQFSRYTSFLLLTLLSAILTNWICYHCIDRRSVRELKNTSLEIERVWEDPSVYINAENRTGLGEMGRPAFLEEERLRLYNEFGYDAILSDYIPLNRTLKDIRHPDCLKKNYLAELPLTSVVIIFHNEHLSVLLRTVHSILQRTPPELLNEIVLVDDCSTLSSLGAQLDAYLSSFLPRKVRLVRTSPRRVGLMAARMVGARAALNSSRVLVFLDSHFEVMFNWLPPLLEPLVLNPRACTCPIIDTLSFKTFEYRWNAGYRGYFDWNLAQIQLPLNAKDMRNPTRPYNNYVMLGGAMAIGVDFFWQLGGFDEGMEYWGGEQFEMSFKIWMCGGELQDVPCSRMGHLYRDPNTKGNTNLYGNYSFQKRNYRRLIETWMDEEYRQCVFERSPLLRTVDPGDLSERRAIRERLQCKSFSWLIDNVFADIKRKFPPRVPVDFGYGVIESVGAPGLCVDNMGARGKVGLYACAKNKTHPHANQFYRFTSHRELRDGGESCLESHYAAGLVTDWGCHFSGGNQLWFYDRFTQWIVQGGQFCMVANAEDRKVHLKRCDTEDPMMRWNIGFLNETRMMELEADISQFQYQLWDFLMGTFRYYKFPQNIFGTIILREFIPKNPPTS